MYASKLGKTHTLWKSTHQENWR